MNFILFNLTLYCFWYTIIMNTITPFTASITLNYYTVIFLYYILKINCFLHVLLLYFDFLETYKKTLTTLTKVSIN